MRIGHVTLDALDDDLGVDRASAANLDHVAEGLAGSGLADDAVADHLFGDLQRLDDHPGAMGRHTFLVAGDQEGERAGHLASLDRLSRGRGEGGDGGLHVDGAAADQEAVHDLSVEGACAPGRRVARRHHIGVAGEAKVRAFGSVAGVKVLDLAELHPSADEAEAG
jgi:hypothetical protein